MIALTISRFPSLTQTKPSTTLVAWDDLVRLLTSHREATEKGGPGWSPVQLAPGASRANESVVTLTALVADVDHDEPIWGLLDGLAYAAHTTYSHVPDTDPHWRVIVPFDEPCPVREWEEVWTRARHMLFPNMDSQCSDPSRFYWLPAHAPGGAHLTRVGQGSPLRWRDLPPVPTDAEQDVPPPRPTSNGTAASAADERPGDRFARETDWAAILEPSGWRLIAERGETRYWRHPGSDKRVGWCASTGGGGYDVLYVWCSASGTPFPSRQSVTKFRAYSLLEHGGDDAAAARHLAGPPGPRIGAAGEPDRATSDAPLEPFPLEALPGVFRRYVAECATSIGAPPELIAVPLLTLAGAVIGNAREVEIKRGWREGPNTYSAVITVPGGKKTPSGKAAKRPLYRVQERLKKEHEAALARHREDMAQWEALSKVGRAGQTPPEPPRFRHVVTTDATTEAIASMLQDCKGLVLERDELSGWTRSMDMYRSGKGADRQHFLGMWSRVALKVDRKGAPPLFVPHPCLSVTGGIQPDMLSELIDSNGREDGFIDRILLAYPAEVEDHWTEDEVSLEALTAVEGVFDVLYELPNALGTDDGVVRLTDEARAFWRTWYEDHAREMRAPDFRLSLRGAWSKMPSQLLRLALILHTVSRPDSLLMELAPLEDGATLIRYFKSHAVRVYGSLGEHRRDMGSTILDAIEANDGQITMSELLHNVFQRHQRASRIRDELSALVAKGVLRYEKQPGTGGRPREVWAYVA